MNRNIYYNLSSRRQRAACAELSKERKEAWYVLGDSGMIANAQGRNPHPVKNWTQYEAVMYVDGKPVEVIPAMTNE